MIRIVSYLSLTCFVLILSCTYSVAQVKVNGQVLHRGEPLKDVTIKVIENETVLRTMLADRKGRFEADIPMGKAYTLLFVCPYMFPVAIDVNTMQEDAGNTLYDVPLTMRMYKRFSGMSEREARRSIGLISKTGKGEEAFTFEPYQKVIEALKPIYAESERRDQAGEDPVNAEVQLPKEISKHPAPAVNDDSSLAIDPSTNADRSNRTTERYEQIEAAKVMERNRRLEKVGKEVSASAEAEQEGASFIEESKKVRRDLAVDDKQREADLVEARVVKQREMIPGQMNSGRPPMDYPEVSATTLIKHSVDDGFFLSEEKLLVEEKGQRLEYRKATYHWLWFDVSYYSRDNNEISEEEYEQVRFATGI